MVLISTFFRWNFKEREARIHSATARTQGDVCSHIVRGLSPDLQHAIDELLQVPDGERRSMLFQLKEYPPEGSYTVILRYIERYHFLYHLKVETIDLSGVSPPTRRV